MSAYTVDYFIEKFEAIPEEKWTTGELVREGGCMCVLGHCGLSDPVKDYVNPTAEALALGNILLQHDRIKARTREDISEGPAIEACWQLNDSGHDIYGFTEPTPKQRILAALRDIKAKGSV